jgi:hypothetical protein
MLHGFIEGTLPEAARLAENSSSWPSRRKGYGDATGFQATSIA